MKRETFTQHQLDTMNRLKSIRTRHSPEWRVVQKAIAAEVLSYSRDVERLARLCGYKHVEAFLRLAYRNDEVDADRLINWQKERLEALRRNREVARVYYETHRKKLGELRKRANKRLATEAIKRLKRGEHLSNIVVALNAKSVQSLLFLVRKYGYTKDILGCSPCKSKYVARR